MLIKRKDRETHRRPLADALPHSPGGFDRRTFLRRSGLAAGGLTALGTLPLGSVRNRRSLLFTGNLVAAVLATLESPSGGETFFVTDA